MVEPKALDERPCCESNKNDRAFRERGDDVDESTTVGGGPHSFKERVASPAGNVTWPHFLSGCEGGRCQKVLRKLRKESQRKECRNTRQSQC